VWAWVCVCVWVCVWAWVWVCRYIIDETKKTHNAKNTVTVTENRTFTVLVHHEIP